VADLANLRISVDSRDVKKAQDDLRALGYTSTQVEGSTKKMSSAFGALKSVLGGLGLALVVREFVQMADSVALLEARIKSVTPAGADLVNIQKQLVGIAKENMVALDATASLYTKLAKPIRALGGDIQTTLNITSAFTKALKIGGASAQEASSAILQFGQAMASGVLRGDEFNSIAEASPRILQAIAEGSGIAAGALRKMAADGALTAGVIGGALLTQMVALEAEAMRIPQTVDGAFTNFKTDLALVASDINKNVGLTSALISVFATLSSTVGALGSIAGSSIVAFSQFMRENEEIVTAATYAVISLGGAMLSLAVAARVAAIVTMLSGTIAGLVSATLAARLGFVAMSATMGIMPAIFFAVRTAAIALYASLGPLGWAMAAVGAAAAFMATRYVSAKQKMADAQKQTTEYTAELGALEKRIKAVSSGDAGKVKALDDVEQLQQYGNALKERGYTEAQVNNLLRARAQLQKVELKQAEQLKNASQAVPKLKGSKGPSEAEQAAKAAAQARENMQNNIADLETQLGLIKAGTVAEEARTRVQLARQGASSEQITKLLDLTKQLSAEEKKAADLKTASENNKAAEQNLALIKQEIALLDQGYSIAEASLRLQLAKTGVTQEQINQIVAETAALDGRKKAIEEGIKAVEDTKKAAEDAQKAFDNLKIDINFDAVFGDMGKAMGGVVSVFDQMLDRQEKYNDAMADASMDEAKRAALQQRNARLQINQYANLVSAAKGFFKEGTGGYKAMEAAEKAFRLFELVMAAKSAAVKIGLITGTTAAVVAGSATETAVTAAAEGAKTGITLAGAAARIPVKIAEGAASMFASLGPLGFAAVAAMVGVMAAFGFSGGGSKAPPKYNTGTGTVFGDSSAQSESLTNSIQRLAEIDKLTMRYSGQMAASLRSIEANIGGLAGLLVRTGDITASGANVKTGTSGIGDINKTLGGLISKIPVLGSVFGGLLSAVGSVVNALFGSKTSIIGQGISGVAQTMREILEGGFEAQNFTNVQTKRKFFGITTSTRYSTQTTAASEEVNRQFTLILDGFYDAITASANPLGLALDEIETRLDGFVVNIGQINLTGLTGQEIQEKLTAVFSAAADSMARAAIAGLDDFQKVGEGYFETVVRVSSGVEEASYLLSQLGVQAIAYTEILNKQGDVGAEIIRQSVTLKDASIGVAGGFAEIITNADGAARDLYELVVALRSTQDAIEAIGGKAERLTTFMLAGAGGADKLNEGLSFIFENFLSEAERSAALTKQLGREFDRLGVKLPESITGFRDLIGGIDTATEEGQRLYGALVALAPQFGELMKTFGEGSAKVQSFDEALSSFTDQMEAIKQQQESAIDTLRGAVGRLAKEASDAEENLRKIYSAEMSKLDAIIGARAAAVTAVQQAYAREAEVFRDAASNFRALGESIRSFASGIFGELIGPSSKLEQARQGFINLVDAARGGSRSALEAIPSAGAQLTDVIAATATSRTDMLRQLLAVNALTQEAALYADEQASVAELQLEKLEKQFDVLTELLGVSREAAASNVTFANAVTALLSADKASAIAEVQKQLITQQIGSIIDLTESTDTLAQAISKVDDARSNLTAVREAIEAAGLSQYIEEIKKTGIREAAEAMVGLEQALEAEIDLRASAMPEIVAAYDKAQAAIKEVQNATEKRIAAYDEQMTKRAGELQQTYRELREEEAKKMAEAVATVTDSADAKIAAVTDAFTKIAALYDLKIAEVRMQTEVAANAMRDASNRLWSAADLLASSTSETGSASQIAAANDNAKMLSTGLGYVATRVDASSLSNFNSETRVVSTLMWIKALLENQRAPSVSVGGPVINVDVSAPVVTVSSPIINVSAPVVTVPVSVHNAISTVVTAASATTTATSTVTPANSSVVPAITTTVSEAVPTVTATSNVTTEMVKLPTITSSSGNMQDFGVGANTDEFAMGGMHDGGWRLVGENGPELEYTGPSRIYNNGQTSEMLNNGELVAEVKYLREELRNAMFQVAKNTGKSYDMLNRWNGNGLPETRDVAA
jgi:tape measure domain-containing protein